MVTQFKIFLLSLIMGGSLLGLAAFGCAQEAPNTSNDSRPAKISDAELRAFIKAYVDNQKIRQQYEPTLMDTTDPKQSQQLQNQANTELTQSLARQNLTVEVY